jgi:hypothetical protein
MELNIKKLNSLRKKLQCSFNDTLVSVEFKYETMKHSIDIKSNSICIYRYYVGNYNINWSDDFKTISSLEKSINEVIKLNNKSK